MLQLDASIFCRKRLINGSVVFVPGRRPGGHLLLQC